MITSSLHYENIDTPDTAKIIRNRIKDIYYDQIRDKSFEYTADRLTTPESTTLIYQKSDKLGNGTHVRYEFKYTVNTSGHEITVTEYLTPITSYSVSKKKSVRLHGEHWEEFEKVIGRLTHRWLSSLYHGT